MCLFFLIVSFVCLRTFGFSSNRALCRFFHLLWVRIPLPRLSGPYSLHLMVNIYVLPLSVLRIVMGRMLGVISLQSIIINLVNLIPSPLCLWTHLCILHIRSDSDLYSKL